MSSPASWLISTEVPRSAFGSFSSSAVAIAASHSRSAPITCLFTSLNPISRFTSSPIATLSAATEASAFSTSTRDIAIAILSKPVSSVLLKLASSDGGIIISSLQLLPCFPCNLSAMKISNKHHSLPRLAGASHGAINDSTCRMPTTRLSNSALNSSAGTNSPLAALSLTLCWLIHRQHTHTYVVRGSSEFFLQYAVNEPTTLTTEYPHVL